MKKFEIISSNGYAIKAKIVFSESIKHIEKVVIACPGFGSDKESSTILELESKLCNNGIAVISFDFVGHGESEVDSENLSLHDCINDLKQIHEYVTTNYNNEKIGIFASSFGAYVALNYVFDNKVTLDSLILRCPAVEMDYIFENVFAKEDINTMQKNGYTYAGFNDMKISYSFFNELSQIRLYEKYKDNPLKMLIIHGSLDNVAPLKHVKRFVNIHPTLAKLEVIEGADHRFKNAGEMDKVMNISLEYFNSCFNK